MRRQGWNGQDDPMWDELPPAHRRAADARLDSTNSAEEVCGEIGLVLVVVLGIVLAINTVLIGLHIG